MEARAEDPDGELLRVECCHLQIQSEYSKAGDHSASMCASLSETGRLLIEMACRSTRAGQLRDGSGSDHVDDHVDVAAYRFGIRARLVRCVRQGLGDAALQTRHADVEASSEEMSAVR